MTFPLRVRHSAGFDSLIPPPHGRRSGHDSASNVQRRRGRRPPRLPPWGRGSSAWRMDGRSSYRRFRFKEYRADGPGIFCRLMLGSVFRNGSRRGDQCGHEVQACTSAAAFFAKCNASSSCAMYNAPCAFSGGPAPCSNRTKSKRFIGSSFFDSAQRASDISHPFLYRLWRWPQILLEQEYRERLIRTPENALRR